MKINLYAPVDCEVKPISECTDDVFAQKTLGDGFVIVPKNKVFYSLFENAKVDLIFDTKHAMFFSYEGLKVLMHIGLDTVKLNGSPFKVNVNVGDVINKETKLVTVDLAMIKKEKLSVETPIVFETTDVNNFKITDLKTGPAKAGDLIASVSFSSKTNDSETDKTFVANEEISFKNKYAIAAETILNLVGSNQNFTSVFNCMTRLRFTIKDKSLVKTDEIKKIQIVKGTNWNGNELQIIIGGEVQKVRDEVEKLLRPTEEPNGTTHVSAPATNNFVLKPSLYKRVLGSIPAIIGPSIPFLIGAGMMMALFSILSINNWLLTSEILVNVGTFNFVQEVPLPPGSFPLGDTIYFQSTIVIQDWVTIGMNNFMQFPFMSAFMYVLGQTGLIVVGVVMCYNTIVFLKGNVILGMLVSLIMVGRVFFPAAFVDATNIDDWSFGTWINDPAGQVWFQPGMGIPPSMGIAEGSIILGTEQFQTIYTMIDGNLVDSGMTSEVLGMQVALPASGLLEVNLNDAVLRGTNRFGWYLFSLGNDPLTMLPVVIGGFEASILPFIAAGFIVTYLDRWIKTWMHPAVDIVFRPLLVGITSLILIFFLAGPLLVLVEFGAAFLINLALGMPLGLGLIILAVSWQILVLFGIHIAVALPMIVANIQANFDPNITLTVYAAAAITTAVWSQFGAGLGVALATRNTTLKRTALASLVPGFFGVSEPIIYGVNLPKVKPFIAGLLGAGIGAAFIMIFDVHVSQPGGQGILAVLSYQPGLMPFILLIWAISIGASVGLTMLMYVERVNEYTYTKNATNKIVKLVKTINNTEAALKLKAEFDVILMKVKEQKQNYKKYDKYLSKVSKFENALVYLENKEQNIREHLTKKIQKIKEKIHKFENNQKDASALNEKYKLIVEKYKTISFENKKNEIYKNQKILKDENKLLIEDLNKFIDKTYKEISSIVEKASKEAKFDQLTKINSKVFNGLNSVDIAYGWVDAQKNNFTKQDRAELKKLTVK